MRMTAPSAAMVAMGQNSMQAPQSVHLPLSMLGRTLRHLSLSESQALSKSARIISGSNIACTSFFMSAAMPRTACAHYNQLCDAGQ
jgi:hypothetical protein